MDCDDSEHLDRKIATLEALAHDGDVSAQYELAVLWDSQNRWDKSFGWMVISAEKRFPKAMLGLSEKFINGFGAPRDIQKAKEILDEVSSFREFTVLGIREYYVTYALVRLGDLHSDPSSYLYDMHLAIKSYVESFRLIDSGYETFLEFDKLAIARSKIGEILLDKGSKHFDPIAGVEIYSHGNEEQCYFAAKCYFEGDMIEKNEYEAVNVWHEGFAGQQDYLDEGALGENALRAQFAYGYCNLFGIGVEQDLLEARDNLCWPSDPLASLSMIIFVLENEDLVTNDIIEAELWDMSMLSELGWKLDDSDNLSLIFGYILANLLAAIGVEKGVHLRERIKVKLSENELLHAEARAREYFSSHHAYLFKKREDWELVRSECPLSFESELVALTNGDSGN
jgi:hypothetical protein